MKNQKKNAYLQNLSSNLNQMRLEKILTDLEVICDNEVFHVHSAVLSASSLYFKDLLNCTERPIKISLTGIACFTFSYMLNFIYTGTADESLDVEKLSLLIEACTWLNIPDLFQHIGALASEIISYGNFLTVWNMADQFRIQSLAQEVEDFAASNYMKLTTKDLFLELSPNRLKRIFSNKNFREIASENIFISLTNWAQQKNDREKQLPQLVQYYQEHMHGQTFGEPEKDKPSEPGRNGIKGKFNFVDRPEFCKNLHSIDSFESNHSFPVGLSVSYEAPEKDVTEKKLSPFRLHPSSTDEILPTPRNLRRCNIPHHTIDVNKNYSKDSTQTYCVRSHNRVDHQQSDDEGTIQSEPVLFPSGNAKRSESIQSCNDNFLSGRNYPASALSHLKRCKGTIRANRRNISPPKRPFCLEHTKHDTHRVRKCHSRLEAGCSACSRHRRNTDIKSFCFYVKKAERNISLENKLDWMESFDDLDLNCDEDQLRDIIKNFYSEHEEHRVMSSMSPLSSNVLLSIVRSLENARKATDCILQYLIKENALQKKVISNLMNKNKALTEHNDKKSSQYEIKKISTPKSNDEMSGLVKCTNVPEATVEEKMWSPLDIQPVEQQTSQNSNDFLLGEQNLLHKSENVDADVEQFIEHLLEAEALNDIQTSPSVDRQTTSLKSASIENTRGKYRVIGCQSGSDDSSKTIIRSSPDNVFVLYVGKCAADTTEKDLRNYLSENGLKVYECAKLLNTQKKNVSSASFRVKLEAESFDSLFKSEKWPKGVVVRPFYRRKMINYLKRNRLKTHSNGPKLE